MTTSAPNGVFWRLEPYWRGFIAHDEAVRRVHNLGRVAPTSWRSDPCIPAFPGVESAGTYIAVERGMINHNNRSIYWAGARSLAWLPLFGIVGAAAGAILAMGVPMVAKPNARNLTRAAFMGPLDGIGIVASNVETSAS